MAEVDLDGHRLGHGEQRRQQHELAHVGDDVAVETAHGAEEEQQRGGAQADREGARRLDPVAATVPHDLPYRRTRWWC